MKKFVFYIILIAYSVSILPFQAIALTESEVRDQMENTNNQINSIDKEINKLSNQIAQTGEEKNTLANMIKELTLTRNKLLKEKDQIQKKITVAGLMIQNISSDIKTKEKTIDISKESLSQTMRTLNQNDKLLLVERLLSVGNFTDFSREYNNIISINEKIKENIQLLSNKKVELLTTKSQKENEKQKLDLLKKDLTQKEQVVLIAKKEKDSLLVETKNKETEYQKMLAEQLKRKEAFEKELDNYEAQLKFILNPKSIPKEGSGALSWPLSYILITSPFGSRWGSFHYGLDFRASIGTQVMAMADGVVMGTGDTDTACKGASYGKWVFIKYNNGLSSTYGHLSLISINKGDKVKEGEVVASSGNTGSSTGPHLHVSVYASDGVKVDTVPSKSCNGKIFTQPIAAKSAYLDPILYLPKATASMYK